MKPVQNPGLVILWKFAHISKHQLPHLTDLLKDKIKHSLWTISNYYLFIKHHYCRQINAPLPRCPLLNSWNHVSSYGAKRNAGRHLVDLRMWRVSWILHVVQGNHQDPSHREGDRESEQWEVWVWKNSYRKSMMPLALNIKEGPWAKECESIMKVGKTRARILLWISRKESCPAHSRPQPPETAWLLIHRTVR